MPRSSRSKSHRQSKHSSKEVKEYSDSEFDLKVKERNGKEQVPIKVSKDLLSGEKRKFDSLSKDGKDALRNGGGGGGGVVDEYVVSKRRKEKAEGGEERSDGLVVKEVKVDHSKEKEMKGGVDSKSRSSRRHDSGSERKGGIEKEESRSSSRIESKRKPERDSSKKDSREVKEKDGRGVEKGKRGEDVKDGEAAKKQISHSVDVSEDRKGRRGREITDEVQNPQLERELDKRVQRREDGYSDKDKHQDDMRNSDDKRSSRGARSRDVSHRDKYEEEDDKYIRHMEDRYHKDGEKDTRYRDVKIRENAEKDIRYRDEKYHEGSYRDNRHRDKYHEDGDRNNRDREDQYLEQGDKNDKRNGGRYRENDKSIQHREEKLCEDIRMGDKQSDSKQKIDSDKDRNKRAQDVKHKNDNTSRDNSDEPEMMNRRDESNSAEINHRMSRKYDLSPSYDDRVTRYKDNKGRRKMNDKETHNYFRSPSTSERHADLDKIPISNCKVDKVTEKVWSNSHNSDVDTTPSNTCWKGSPGSNTHAARDYDREKYTQKDDGQSSAERRVEPDAFASPPRKVDKSPSSTSTERRHLNRSEIRQTLDTEEFAQRKGSSRNYSGREGKGSWELQKMHPVDKHSQADADNSSASSTFARISNFSGNLRSRPPPPFRNGLDSPAFGFAENDSRGRSHNRHRKNGDSNMVRLHENTWKGVPNWSSPVPNGFVPFQHGSPSVTFHPGMQQFPAPPIFPFRPTMDLNNALPFHMPDTARFSSHGRQPGRWNPVDELCPPLNGWDANNAVYNDNTHGYGRLDRDQNRNQMSSGGWDSSTDMWKEQKNGSSGDWPSASGEDLNCPTVDEVSAGQAGRQSQSELDQSNSREDSLEVHSSDPLNVLIPETPKSVPDKSRETLEMSVKDDAGHEHIYLSKLDISIYLTQPDLYDQLTSLIHMDQNTLVDEDNSKIIYIEEVKNSKLSGDEIWSGALFTSINDSVFQNAMSIYKKQREEIRPINKDAALSSNMEILEVIQIPGSEKAPLGDDKPYKGVLASRDDTQEQDAKSAVPDEGVDMSGGVQEAAMASHKFDEPCLTDIMVVSDDQASLLNEMEVEVDPVPREQVEAVIVTEELSEVLLPGNCEETKPSDRSGNILSAANSEGHELVKAECVPVLYSDMFSGVCEAGMPESVESESVSLSRIHHSPESTH